MAIQLDLFEGVCTYYPQGMVGARDYDEMAERQGILSEIVNFNPCSKCRYNGICDEDECAMKEYKLDSKKSTINKSWKYGF